MKKLFYIAHMRLPTERAHGFQVMRMCSAWAASGTQVTLLVPSRASGHTDDPFSFYQIAPTFQIERIKSIDLFPFRFIPRSWCFWVDTLTFSLSLLFRVGAFREAEVFSRDPVSTFFLMWLVPHIAYEVHDAPGQSWLNQLLFSHLKKIVVTNAIKKQQLTELFNVPERDVFVAHHGVDRSAFSLSLSKEDARRQLGFATDPHYAVYTGHLFDWKGVYTLARAAHFLPEHIHLVFVGGTTDDAAAFTAFVAGESLPRIHVIGHVPHEKIPHYLAMADVLVLPTSGEHAIGKYESSPLKLFEYMSSNRPIVASDLPAVREIVDEQSVTFVHPDDPALLADAIAKVVNREVPDTSAHAYERAGACSWERRASDIIQFICDRS